MSTFSALSLVHLFHPSHRTHAGLGYSSGRLESDSLRFTAFAYNTMIMAWIATLATGLVICALSLRMTATKRHFHQLLVVVQAVSLLGYSLTIGGYGLLPSAKGGHVLIGLRDEFAVHYILPLFCLPFIVYVTNNVAGIFMTEGVFIIATLVLATLYGAVTLFLPKDWLGSFVAVLSILFAIPYLTALVSTWPSSVKAAPKRVRKILKSVCFLQVLVVAAQLVTIDLAINQTIGVDIENLIMTIADLVMYSVVPCVLLCSSNALKDVYSREEYIMQTKRAATSLPSSAVTPHLISSRSSLLLSGPAGLVGDESNMRPLA